MSKTTSNSHTRTQTLEKHSEHCPHSRSAQKPFILAVETSGRKGSVAIALGEKLLAEKTFSAPMKHSAEIFPAVSTLLNRLGRKPQQIDHIYISSGPGSFTGLRIAAAVAKTMNLANAAKIVAVDTLDVIAANATDYMKAEKTPIEKIAAILDAKRAQFYIAVYQHHSSKSKNAIRNMQCGPRVTSHTIWKKLLQDSLMTTSQFLDQFACNEKPVWLLGEGLVYYKDKFKADGIYFLDEKYWWPKAAKVHLLGWQKARNNQFADPLTLQPTYLRKPDAKVKRTP